MGKVFKFIAGAVLIGATLAFPGAGIWAVAGGALKSLAMVAGSGLLASVLPSGVRQRQGIETNVADPIASLPVVYGRAKVGLRLVDVREDPASGNKDLYVVGALCHGSSDGSGIQGIDEIYFNGKLAVNAAGTIQAPFIGKLTLTKFLGTDAQNVATRGGEAFDNTGVTLNGKFPTAWPTTSNGRGVACVVLKLVYDQEVYAGGIPQVTVVVRGAKTLDVRTGSTTYNTNPALILHDYLRSVRFGMRLPAGEVDGGTTGSFAAMANHYDEDVTSTGGGTQDRFTCNGWLDTLQAPAENIRHILTSCRGNLVYTGGIYKLFTRRAVAPTAFALTESNIVGEFRYTVPGIRDSANVARATYMPAQATDSETPWAPDQLVYPRPTDTNDFLAADNGFEVTREHELPLTANKYTAEQIAAVELQESRDMLTVEVTAHESALQLEVGDVVPVTHSSPGWSEKPFWVDAVVLDPVSGLVRLALHEYNEDAYTLPGQGAFTTSPNSDLPDPTAIAAPSGVTVTCDSTTASRLPDGRMVNRILVEWTPPADPFLNHYLFFAGKVGGDINTYGPALLGDTFFYIGPVPSDELWQVQMTAVNGLGITSTPAPSPAATFTTPNLNVEDTSANVINNGAGQHGAVGQNAPSWTAGSGNRLLVASDQFRLGDRSLKITNATAIHSYDYEDWSVVENEVWRIRGWLRQSGLTGGSTEGAGVMIQSVSGVTEIDTVAAEVKRVNGTASTRFYGLNKTDTADVWHYINAVFLIKAGSGVMRVAPSLGWSGAGPSGSAWFDGLILERVETAIASGARRAWDSFDANLNLFIDTATETIFPYAQGASGSLSKTVVWDAPSFNPSTDATPFELHRYSSNPYGLWVRPNVGDNTAYTYYCPLVLPPGVTLTDVTIGSFRNGASDQCDLAVERVDVGAIATVQSGSAGTGRGSLSLTMSEVVANKRYYLKLTLKEAASAGHAEATGPTFTYTMPDFRKGY